MDNLFLQVLHWAGWIIIAKWVLVVVMLISTFICWLVLVKVGALYLQLASMEAVCDEATTSVMFAGYQLRQQLAAYRNRILAQTHREPFRMDPRMLMALAQKAFPLVSLFFAKEKNLIKWGTTLLNVVKGFVRKGNR